MTKKVQRRNKQTFTSNFPLLKLPIIKYTSKRKVSRRKNLHRGVIKGGIGWNKDREWNIKFGYDGIEYLQPEAAALEICLIFFYLNCYYLRVI